MSNKAMDYAFETTLKGAQKLMLLALADCSNDEGVCYPGVGRLAKKCSVTPRYAKKLLSALETAGEIVVAVQGGTTTISGNTNRYFLKRFRDIRGMTTPDYGKRIDQVPPPTDTRGEPEDTPLEENSNGGNCGTPHAVSSGTPDGGNCGTPKPPGEPPGEPTTFPLLPAQTLTVPESKSNIVQFPDCEISPQELDTAMYDAGASGEGKIIIQDGDGEITIDNHKLAVPERIKTVKAYKKHIQKLCDGLPYLAASLEGKKIIVSDSKNTDLYTGGLIPAIEYYAGICKKYDWDGMKDAVKDVFKIYGNRSNHFVNMLLGRATAGEWGEHNLDTPMTPQEVIVFGKWYWKTYPGREDIVRSAETVQSEVLRFRDEQSKPRAQARIVTAVAPQDDIKLTDEEKEDLKARLFGTEGKPA